MVLVLSLLCFSAPSVTRGLAALLVASTWLTYFTMPRTPRPYGHLSLSPSDRRTLTKCRVYALLVTGGSTLLLPLGWP
jgi:hypothetical protein